MNQDGEDRTTHAVNRRLRLLDAIIGELLKSHAKAGEIWNQLKPDTGFRLDEDLQPLTRSHLAELDELSDPDWARVEKTVAALCTEHRKLLEALFCGVNWGTKDFADYYLAHYSPNAIKTAVQMEKGRFQLRNTSRWHKYEELTKDFTVQSLADKVAQKVLATAEDFLLDRFVKPGD